MEVRPGTTEQARACRRYQDKGDRSSVREQPSYPLPRAGPTRATEQTSCPMGREESLEVERVPRGGQPSDHDGRLEAVRHRSPPTLEVHQKMPTPSQGLSPLGMAGSATSAWASQTRVNVSDR